MKELKGAKLKHLGFLLIIIIFSHCQADNTARLENDEDLYAMDGRRVKLSNKEYAQLSEKYSISQDLDKYDRIIRGPAAQELIKPGSTTACSCGDKGTEEEIVPDFLVEDQDHLKGLIGRILFYDTRLSLSNEISCASCHKQNLAFADNVAFSEGENNLLTKSNTPSLAYQVYKEVATGRQGQYSNLDDAISQNLVDFMGNQSIEEIISRVQDDTDYQLLSEISSGSKILTKSLFLESLSTFIMSMTPFNSTTDRQNITGSLLLTAQENAGKELFDKICTSCHTDDMSKNNFDNNFTSDAQNYKTSFLRNVSLTAPYMHDGRFKTLKEVLEHYRGSDAYKHDSKLNYESKNNIIAYLKTLDDEGFKGDSKYSNPNN